MVGLTEKKLHKMYPKNVMITTGMVGCLIPYLRSHSTAAKVIWRQDFSLKSLPKDWRSLGWNLQSFVYKVSSLITLTEAKRIIFLN